MQSFARQRETEEIREYFKFTNLLRRRTTGSARGEAKEIWRFVGFCDEGRWTKARSRRESRQTRTTQCPGVRPRSAVHLWPWCAINIGTCGSM